MGNAATRKSGDLPSLLNHTGAGRPGRRLDGNPFGARGTFICFNPRREYPFHGSLALGPQIVTEDPCLVVKDVEYVAQNNQRLLHPVSFTLERGAVLAIAGPNGAGKSTLLNLLSGLEPLALGNVLIDGKNLNSMTSEERARQIAVVSQHGNPDGRLTLRDYVALGQMPIWSDRSALDHAAALARILDMTRLTDLAASPMARLSGGERQRAHIARALAQEPRLLFLDEPTNHLDPDAKGRMLSLVTSLGITVIMIVHDLVMIPEFASHVALVHAARLIGFGPVSEVLTPHAVRDAFGVGYLEFAHEGRVVAALDIRKTELPPSAFGAS